MGSHALDDDLCWVCAEKMAMNELSQSYNIAFCFYVYSTKINNGGGIDISCSDVTKFCIHDHQVHAAML